MHPQLSNPVWNALCSRDARLGTRAGDIAFFNEDVSPFAGFPEEHPDGFGALAHLLPAGRRILHATRKPVAIPAGWALSAHVEGLQFVYEQSGEPLAPELPVQPLGEDHISEMVQLATLTKPGPFNTRTIDFGNYYGVFSEGRLAAMTGQRLHLPGYSELSAVCTHPDHLGKGYAAALVQQQLHIICAQGEVPFLHVRADNERAIALYERLGFRANGPMHFYFMKRI
jgi:ribosomal protein S18 acetylase RimI-like enzyme